MEKRRGSSMGTMAAGPAVCVLLAGAVLVGCGATSGGQSVATQGASGSALAQVEENKTSPIIQSLINRRSVLQPKSSFEQISHAVLASNARPAEADLRAARLRAQAASKNWLPRIGPSISLSSMGDLVAQLLFEQVIFDNGRKRAERAFAAADVQATAVNLSKDTNDRVAEALKLHISAERAREEARTAQKATARMQKFINIIDQRVSGGVSDLADLQVARSKLNELKAELARAREAELTSVSELQAMAGRVSVGIIKGIDGISIPNGGTQEKAAAGRKGKPPLNVLLAQAEGLRKIERAKIARAALLPGVSVKGGAGEGADIRLDVSGETLLGVGTGDSIAALTAARDAAKRGVQQAVEDNRRIVNRLSQQRVALRRQQSESAALVNEARQTYRLFLDQFENSGRPIMDVVSVYENAMRLERDAVRLKYELVAIEVDIAALYGTLLSGENI